MIPADKVREVSERLSIVEVIGEYMQLKRSGANYLGLCPFHGEKTPSFNVNPAREIFHCFGCGAGGDLFAFVMRIEGISFPEAVKKLASRTGVTIEERPLSPAELKAREERDEQRTIMLLAAQHYRDALTRRPEGAAGRDYLQRREVAPEITAAYGIGFAPQRRDSLSQALRAAGHKPEVAATLGLIRRGERGDWYDLLHNRLIFPIRDHQGQPIAFAGRVLDNSLPKYINSPESPLYRKSNTLFGLDLALREIRLASAAIVVEGYFDHLALYRAGVKNVVATCGTALTDSHIALLKKHAERIYLLFDGDNAGRTATVRAMELCLEQKLPAYVVTLPNGEDPDSFLAGASVEAFRTRVESAKPAFEQFLHWLLSKTPPSSTDNKARLVREIVPRLARITEAIERTLYEKEVCRLLDIDDLAGFHRRVQQQQTQTPRSPKAAEPSALPVRRPPPAPRDRGQELLLVLMACFPGARDEAARHGCDLLFDEQHRPLAEALLAVATPDDSTETGLWSRVLTQLADPHQQDLAARLALEDQAGLDDWRNAFNDCRQRREKAGMKELKQIAVRLATLPPDSDEYHELLARADRLRNRKSTLQ